MRQHECKYTAHSILEGMRDVLLRLDFLESFVQGAVKFEKHYPAQQLRIVVIFGIKLDQFSNPKFSDKRYFEFHLLNSRGRDCFSTKLMTLHENWKENLGERVDFLEKAVPKVTACPRCKGPRHPVRKSMPKGAGKTKLSIDLHCLRCREEHDEESKIFIPRFFVP